MHPAPEQLQPVRWKVWLTSDLSRRVTGMAVTRLQAMIIAAKRFGRVDSHGDPVLEGIDAEMVREGEAVAAVVQNGRAA